MKTNYFHSLHEPVKSWPWHSLCVGYKGKWACALFISWLSASAPRRASYDDGAPSEMPPIDDSGLCVMVAGSQELVALEAPGVKLRCSTASLTAVPVCSEIARVSMKKVLARKENKTDVLVFGGGKQMSCFIMKLFCAYYKNYQFLLFCFYISWKSNLKTQSSMPYFVNSR